MTTDGADKASSVAGDTTFVPDYLAKLDLTSRQYVVVGAGQGIGRQVAHALAQAGAARLLCVDVDLERAQKVALEVKVGVPWQGDVSTAEDARELVSTTPQALDRLDGVVDIVGQASWARVSELTEEIWARDFGMCLDHAYRISRGLIDFIRASGGGSFVFISSVSALYGAANHAAYGAAKAALNSWIQSLAVELGPDNIRANGVAPGTVLTPRMDVLWNEAQKAAIAANAPLNRLGKAEDIAAAVLFFMSDLASFITGKTLVVDGGVASKFPFQVSVPD